MSAFYRRIKGWERENLLVFNEWFVIVNGLLKKTFYVFLKIINAALFVSYFGIKVVVSLFGYHPLRIHEGSSGPSVEVERRSFNLTDWLK